MGSLILRESEKDTHCHDQCTYSARTSGTNIWHSHGIAISKLRGKFYSNFPRTRTTERNPSVQPAQSMSKVEERPVQACGRTGLAWMVTCATWRLFSIETFSPPSRTASTRYAPITATSGLTPFCRVFACPCQPDGERGRSG
jgi:hypothetical protein